MNKPKINFIAVLIAAVVMWVIGAIWYSVFASLWTEFTGITEEMASDMSTFNLVLSFAGSFVAYIILFYVMAHFIFYAGDDDAKGGLQTGFWTWLGFVATSMFVTNIYTAKPFGLWIIDSGYWLISMLIGGVILATMKKKNKEVESV